MTTHLIGEITIIRLGTLQNYAKCRSNELCCARFAPAYAFRARRMPTHEIKAHKSRTKRSQEKVHDCWFGKWMETSGSMHFILNWMSYALRAPFNFVSLSAVKHYLRSKMNFADFSLNLKWQWKADWICCLESDVHAVSCSLSSSAEKNFPIARLSLEFSSFQRPFLFFTLLINILFFEYLGKRPERRRSQ